MNKLTSDEQIAADAIRIRLGQLIINEMIKARAFKIPIHLAMGHEAIAAAVNAVMGADDSLLLSHRNIHYNIARATSFKAEIDELRLNKEGVNKGTLGSMNMSNPTRGVIYTSSILGNNLSVAAGASLAAKMTSGHEAVFVVTGDGAIEEGAFYETIEFSKSLEIPLIVLVEVNGWSLATRIHERRCSIDLGKLAGAFGLEYLHLSGNDACAYANELGALRARVSATNNPAIVEVDLTTLGSWVMEAEGYPDGKFINYHHGGSPSASLSDWPVIAADETDPLYVLEERFEKPMLGNLALEIRSSLEKDAA